LKKKKQKNFIHACGLDTVEDRWALLAPQAIIPHRRTIAPVSMD
jgi:hypothetical protein